MKKKITELGHSDRLKIHVNPSKFTSTLAIKFIQNDLLSKVTAPMGLKFDLQHYKAAGLQNDKIQAGRDQTWPLLLKIAKPQNSTFLYNHLYSWLKFCLEH